jgi:hypothetical protein
MRNTPKNLNEEIMKMRKLMNFNISENSHNVLSENVINESVITENQLKSLHVEQETTQEYSDQFLENWLLKRLDDSSPIWWNSKKTTPESKKVVIEELRDYFNEYGKKFNREYKNIIKLRNGGIHLGHIKLPLPSEEITTTYEPLPPLQFQMMDTDGKQLFKDNKWDPTENFIKLVKDKVESMGYPKETTFTNFNIVSSASKLRNTLNPNITWKELTDNRAQSAEKVVRGIMTQMGYKLPKSNIKSLGGQGNNPYMKGDSVINTGGEREGLDSLKPEYWKQVWCDNKRPNDVNCGSKRRELDKYKYITIEFTPTIVPPQREPEKETTETKDYIQNVWIEETKEVTDTGKRKKKRGFIIKRKGKPQYSCKSSTECKKKNKKVKTKNFQ